MQCTLVGSHYFQILDPFDVVLNLVKTGDSIGFAVALQNGAFSVSRFNMQGALPAIQKSIDEAARRKLQQIKPSQPIQPGIKDVTL
jgi:hypothetical protein